MATATKTSASSAAAATEDYDFDNWDQDAEDAALRRLNDVKHIIVEGNFVGRFGDGVIVKIPLELTLSMIDQLQQEFPTPVDQFKHLIITFGGDDLAAQIETRSIIPLGIMAERYFRCLRRAQELAFPES